jgi:hypothetical protein
MLVFSFGVNAIVAPAEKSKTGAISPVARNLCTLTSVQDLRQDWANTLGCLIFVVSELICKSAAFKVLSTIIVSF